MKTILVLVMMMTLRSFGVTVTEPMLKAIAIVESGNKVGVKGDFHLKTPSVGLYQVRKNYLDDVMKIYKKECIAEWGRKLTMEDMLTSREKSTWVVKRYLKHYGKRYEKITKKTITVDIIARIHNGGPEGWNKNRPNLYSATSKYSSKVLKVYHKS